MNKQSNNSWQNLDLEGKVNVWQFTFLGDTSYIESEKYHNNQTVQEIAQEVVENNFPLTKSRRGDRLNIVKINALGEMARRLQKMGLLCGVELEVISDNPSGSVIVAVKNYHIGLDSNLASKIIVSSQAIN